MPEKSKVGCATVGLLRRAAGRSTSAPFMGGRMCSGVLVIMLRGATYIFAKTNQEAKETVSFCKLPRKALLVFKVNTS